MTVTEVRRIDAAIEAVKEREAARAIEAEIRRRLRDALIHRLGGTR